jgi:hypothetical protein
MSNDSDHVRRTRSGRPITRRADSPHNDYRSPSPKKRRGRTLKPKPSIPHLTGPLSVVTNDMNIPVRDMGAWVNRSLEERHAEVTKKKGYVTRPMNSFMLYRSAYSERTKAWCTANNHQVVSSVSGASWPLEPASVREFYNDLSKTERQRHAEAFPEYRFQPAKPGQKRNQTQEPQGENGNASENGDADWAASHGVRRTRTRRDDYTYNHMPDRSIPSPAPSLLDSDYYPAPSAYGAVRSIAAPYPPRLMYPESQQQLLEYQVIPQSHNVAHHPIPGLLYHPSHLPQQQHIYDMAPIEEDEGGFVGLPGESRHELDRFAFGHQTLDTLEPPASIDPLLSDQFENHLPNSISGDIPALPYHLEYDTEYTGIYKTNEHDSDPSRSAIPTLAGEGHRYEPRQWKPEQIPILEHASDFEELLKNSANVNGMATPELERRLSDLRSVHDSNVGISKSESRPESVKEVHRVVTPVQTAA